MYNSNVWRTRQDEQVKGLTILGTNWSGDELRQVTKIWCIIAPIEHIEVIDIFNKKSVAIIDALILFI